MATKVETSTADYDPTTGEVREDRPRQGREVALQPTRLPYPGDDVVEQYGLETGRAGWRALTDAVWPAAKTVEAVLLALSYCKARRLDPFKRPVHIVPIWSTPLGRLVESVWPGIGELRTTAFRTGLYAGAAPMEWGPDIKIRFKKNGSELIVPEYGQMTVFRLLGGEPRTFPGPKVYWLETYATEARDSDLPNAMWGKRIRGQLEKCVEAAALRRAFPEEIGNDLIPEEVDGEYGTDGVAPPERPQRSSFAERGPVRDVEAEGTAAPRQAAAGERSAATGTEAARGPEASQRAPEADQPAKRRGRQPKDSGISSDNAAAIHALHPQDQQQDRGYTVTGQTGVEAVESDLVRQDPPAQQQQQEVRREPTEAERIAAAREASREAVSEKRAPPPQQQQQQQDERLVPRQQDQAPAARQAPADDDGPAPVKVRLTTFSAGIHEFTLPRDYMAFSQMVEEDLRDIADQQPAHIGEQWSSHANAVSKLSPFGLRDVALRLSALRDELIAEARGRADQRRQQAAAAPQDPPAGPVPSSPRGREYGP